MADVHPPVGTFRAAEVIAALSRLASGSRSPRARLRARCRIGAGIGGPTLAPRRDHYACLLLYVGSSRCVFAPDLARGRARRMPCRQVRSRRRWPGSCERSPLGSPRGAAMQLCVACQCGQDFKGPVTAFCEGPDADRRWWLPASMHGCSVSLGAGRQGAAGRARRRRFRSGADRLGGPRRRARPAGRRGVRRGWSQRAAARSTGGAIPLAAAAPGPGPDAVVLS